MPAENNAGADGLKAQEEKEAIRSAFRGALFRGTLSSVGAGVSAFFSYVHYAAANVMAEEAAKMLPEGKIVGVAQYALYHKLLAAATNNDRVGLAFGAITVFLIASALRNFKDLRQAKRPQGREERW